MALNVLDTDTLTLYREGHPPLVQRVDAHAADELAVAVITVEEVLSGWYSFLRQATQPPRIALAYRMLADNTTFLGRWRILPFEEPAIARYEQLQRMRLQVRRMDLRIAAIVLEHGATLVTRNVRDFQRIPGLAVENWAD